MARVLLAAWMLFCTSAAPAADDFKVIKLEQDVRNLERQVQSLSRQLDELRTHASRSGERIAPPAASATPVDGGAWLDAAKWRRLKPGMSELEVIAALGPPASMREENGMRTLLYAMEIGSSGFLSGSVSLRDRVVVVVQTPVLK
jgi:hypothetical protein